jgi:DNA-binding NtrC family response regulator
MNYSPWAQDPCIMIVDTDSAFRKLCRDLLEREGFKVLTARNSVEALVLAADYPFAIDLLLTDVGMRVYQNGVELTECFGVLRPETRVLLTVASCDLAGAALKSAADWDLLPKPIEAGSLPTAVRRVLGLAEAALSTPA